MQNDLSRVVDAISGVIWIAGPDGGVDFLTQRWCKYTGLSADVPSGQAWQTATHPEDLPELRERWRSILVSGESGEIEARVRRFDGEYRRCLIRTVPVHDDQGKVVRWYGISADIDDRDTERESSRVSSSRSLDEITKSESRLRTIIDTIPVIAWALCRMAPENSGTSDGTIIRVFLLRLLGAGDGKESFTPRIWGG